MSEQKPSPLATATCSECAWSSAVTRASFMEIARASLALEDHLRGVHQLEAVEATRRARGWTLSALDQVGSAVSAP